MEKKKEKDDLHPPQPLQGNFWNGVPTPLLTDPFGSYTGRALDPYEKPVQDADDL